MKLKTSLKNNLSLQLVTFMATVLSTVFGTAMQVKAVPDSVENLSSTINNGLQQKTESHLIAQLWSELNTQELSLAPSDRNMGSASDVPAQLSLTQLDPQQQLIAQLWSELNTQELSLAPSDRNMGSASDVPAQLSLTQLDPQQQLIAQLWSELNTQELSLAPSDRNMGSASDVPAQLSLTQLDPQQQLIAQLWSELNTQELSLAPSDRNIGSASDVPAQLSLTQLNPQQQLIAQLWSELNTQELSLAPSDRNIGNFNGRLNTEELSIKQFSDSPQVITQNWTDIDIQNLSLAEPNDNSFTLPDVTEEIPSQPRKKPVINPPDKREIAARLALEQVQIISPAPGVILDENHNDSVTIQYPSNTVVKLEVNGTELDNSSITQQQLDEKRKLITKTWQGAELRNGKNVISAIATRDGFDRETTREVMVQDSTTLANSVQTTDTTPKRDRQDSESAPKQPQPNTDNAKSNSDSVKILSPAANSVLDRIYSSVIIQYPEGASVIMQVNGKSVDSAQVGNTQVSSATGLVTQTWYGIIFSSGVNTLSVLSTTDGTNYSETSINVTVPGRPEAIALKTVESEIPADGQAVTTIKGGYIDSFGTTTPWNQIITLKSSAGEFIGTDLEPDEPGFQVKPVDGEFTAQLQAGYDAKIVSILARSDDLEAYTQIKFKTTLRETPLLTGFADIRFGARGTNYYDSYRDFLPLDEDNGAEFDFTAAGFIVGSIGQWSYTGAFNSDRGIDENDDRRDRLFRTYGSSEPVYPVYGDNSSSEVTTPSTDNVYLRLERNPKVEFADPDYFMWGDYSTEEFSTESQEFTAISRQLHGFKSNYNLGNFQFNVLYANDIEGFQRDAIAPDGTSGFYFLSRRLLIPGSEDVYVELSPLNDPGNVVFRQRLIFGTDYEIDYDRGTLLFSEPVLSTEVDDNGNILVRRIVATYQFETEGSDSSLIAGRGRFHFNRDSERPSWLGASLVNEDRGDQDFLLWGFDSYFSLGNWGNLTAEYAQSDNETIFAETSGSAYRLEGEVRFSDNIYGRAYYHRADEGFSNNATLSFIPGQIRYGSQIEAQVAQGTKLRFLYEHQDNQGVAPRPLDELEEFLELGTEPIPGSILDNTLDSITAGVEQQIGSADLGVDLIWRDRSDNQSPETLDTTSTQLRSRLSLPIAERVNFHAFNDLTLSDNTDAVYSDRLGFGLDWEILSGLSLVLNQQWFTQGNLAGESLTSIGLQGQYEPWTNAAISARYNLTSSADGIGNVGAIAIGQKIVVAPGLDVDLNYENTFNGFDTTGSGVRFAQPYAVGQSTSALGFGSGSTYSVGITYSDNPNFTADAQWQYSDRNNGGNTVWSAGVVGKLSSALTALLDYNQASSANQTLDIGTTRNLRLGLAYRDPKRDNFNALLRYEYEEDGGIIPETLLLGKGTGTQEHLFGLEAIYAPNWRWEFYGKYAFRNSKTFISNDFVGDSNISLGQLRVTYRLNYHFDLVAEGRTIWQPSANYTETGFLLEAGYYLTPEIRLSGGYVFGSADDKDFTGTRSAGGPYVGMTLKLNSLLDGFGQNRAPIAPEGVTEVEEVEEVEVEQLESTTEVEEIEITETEQRLEPHVAEEMEIEN